MESDVIIIDTEENFSALEVEKKIMWAFYDRKNVVLKLNEVVDAKEEEKIKEHLEVILSSCTRKISERVYVIKTTDLE